MSRRNKSKSYNGLYLGWRRDLPDLRDYHVKHKEVASILSESKRLKKAKKTLPEKVNLTKWFSPVEDQESLGSCTANAGVGLMEYFQRRAYGEYIDGSRLFLYKATRTLEGDLGDVGAYLRTTMKAMAVIGVCPEGYWWYDIDNYEDEPPAFCYAYGQNYRATNYYRHDLHGMSPDEVLESIKLYLAAALPCMFGFSVFSSMPNSGDGKGEIPFPSMNDTFQGGHAVVAVGYDDSKKIGNSKGALRIRNSWGANWGRDGYGWIPYDYVTQGLANDFWSLLQAEFVSSDLFN